MRPLSQCWIAFSAMAMSSASSAQPSGEATSFNPESFFVGRTHGEGCLKVMLSGCRKVTVEGSGRIDTDGDLILDQDVIEGVKAPKHRQWRLHRTGATSFTGTLTDAAGPTTVEVVGPTLKVGYVMQSGFRAEQRLTLAATGTTVSNHMVIRKFGIVVATLDETITRSPDTTP